MKNNQHLSYGVFLFLTIFYLGIPSSTIAQCPGALTCDGAKVICSIGDLNGFTCKNPTIPNTNFPLSNLCFGTGVAQNLNWWAFVGCGGPLNITFQLDIENCRDGQGIQGGVFYGGCDGNLVWDCNATCSSTSFTLSGNTIPCEIYYLWIDGCQGDVCNFTLSISGADCAPNIPPIPSLTTSDQVCPCNQFEVCAPDLNGCEPSYIWKVNGVLMSRDECAFFGVPQDAKEGDIIEVCLILVTGNPNSYCDKDSVCTNFIVEPIQQDFGDCVVACFEEQPIFWQGFHISATCISPPCSVRVNGPDGCCIDSIKPFILLPPPGQGAKDTFICDPGIPYEAENGTIYIDEICDELIEFKKHVIHPGCPTIRKRCDTSYTLNLGRFMYKKEWKLQCDSCSSGFTLSANIIQYSSCPKFDSIAIVELIWLDSTQTDTIAITNGLGSIPITMPGEYCLDVYASVNGKLCTAPDRECYTISESDFEYPEVLIGDSTVCKDSISTYQLNINNQLCSFEWSVNGQGSIITPNPNDSSRIEVKWDSLVLDTVQLCVDIHAMCYSDQKCIDIFICPLTTTTEQVLDNFTFFYSIQNQSIYWSDLDDFNNIKLTILDLYGRPVLSTKIRDSEGKLGISKLNSGIYLAFISDTENQVNRVIKCVLR